MRVMVFFDLPVETNENKREYRRFRKLLVKNGFVMLQESVYCRMTLNQNIAASVTSLIRTNKPKDGLVQVLTITEKQFARMEYITGNFSNDVISNDKRIIFL